MAIRPSLMRWLASAGVLLVFLLLLVLLDRTLTLDATGHWVLRLGFLLLGLIAAGGVWWYLRPTDQEAALDPSDDVLLAISAARARLPRGRFGSRPMVLVLGPEGSAKTTSVARGGGDPELLAGDAPATINDVPTPTATANVWLMQDALITELWHGLLGDATRFKKVARALRAPTVAAAVGKGAMSPRAILLCVPCDLFYTAGGLPQLEAMAQSFRQRLADASRELGLAVPVYVLFTKMDRIPHFEPWASVFTKDELRAPLGFSLPFDREASTGNYAERLAPRVEAAFRQLADAVAARRLDALGREAQLDRRYAAYEWPREMRKLQSTITQFLIELCRPVQLGASPQLRGLYFTGARPVLLADRATPGGASAPRKVPEWVFLDRLLRDVVLADPGAATMAHGGQGVQRTRRVLLGSVIAASLALLTGVTISWVGNRALQGRVAEAAAAVATLPTVQSSPGTIAAPSIEAMTRLEGLRALLDTVQGYENDGVPLRLRLGLWRGAALLDAGRPVWMHGFRTQLFGETWKALGDSLTAVAQAGTSTDYATNYARLKAYLISTTRADQSTVPFLAPVLYATWTRGTISDADVTALAMRQFEYFAAILPVLPETGQEADARLVEQVRGVLSRSTGEEQIYANMLGAANRAVPAVKVPQSPATLTATREVAGGFSAKGAAFMAEAFRNPDPYLQGEEWVVGKLTAARVINRDSMIVTLRSRYAADYQLAWTQVVQSAVVARPSSVADAATKLDELSGVQSPILQLLQTVAVNTAIDSVTRETFQPVHAVTPPEITDKFVSEKNKPYMDGLIQLQGAMRQIASMPPAVDTPSTQALVMAAQLAGGTVTSARTSARQVAQTFSVGSALAGPVEQLLLAPISGVEVVLRSAASQRPPARRPVVAGGGGGGGGGAAGVAAEIASLNERGRAICSRIDPLTSRFPFNPDATADANLADVKAILTPGSGELAVFVQERLTPYLDKQGRTYIPKGGGRVELSKAFIDFLNRATEVSDAFFTEDPTTPKVSWAVIGEISDRTPLLVLRNDGKEARFDKNSFRNLIVWPATNGRDALLQAQFKKNKPVTVKAASGDWGMFHLALSADANDGTRMTWNVSAKDAEPVAMRFEAQRRESAGVLTRGWLGRMSCVPQVTK